MAGDPLDEWRETLAADKQTVGLMPSGKPKNLLNKKLREIEVILQVVERLPKNDPFRARVEAVARRLQETRPNEAEGWDAALHEYAACVKIARRMNWKQAVQNRKKWPKG
jgi:hypothetical protein